MPRLNECMGNLAPGRERKQGVTNLIKVLYLAELLCRSVYIEAPPLPSESASPPKDAKEEMQDFLDDLLSW